VPKIVPIIEGPGEVESVPILINKMLFDISRPAHIEPRISVANCKNAHGIGNLTAEGYLERFLQYAFNEPEVGGIIVVRDADKGCPITMAKDLADRARKINPPVSVSIVVAKCEFEAWFLASLKTIAGKVIDGRPGILEGTVCDEPEDISDVKGWIGRNMPGSRSYKPAFDQAPMTKMIDTAVAYHNSRSFRRFSKAICELVSAIDNSEVIVTPSIAE